MKLKLGITFVLSFLLLGFFAVTSSSCSTTSRGAKNSITYNRSSRIKAYNNSNSRGSFSHDKSVRKQYVIKKKK
ncbi:MAG TPA: hypothetical protein VK994_02030 [Bacteroidales bacterium]|nr:hypothetical protein [Bacteroidales bacterium]